YFDRTEKCAGGHGQPLGNRSVQFLGPTFSNLSFLGGRLHRCFYTYGYAGRLGETPYCLHNPIVEDGTNLPPERLVIRLLVVRGFTAFGLTAPLWHGCIVWNEVPADVVRGIIATLRPDHHVKVAALGRAKWTAMTSAAEFTDTAAQVNKFVYYLKPLTFTR
ncbi:hypothetical protein CSKR_113028, partial [Clonorchis sinensis]